MREVEASLAAGAQSLLARPENGHGRPALTFDRLVAATAGDKLAPGALEDAGDYLGRGIAALVNLLNPPLVVVGGEIARAEAVVFPPVVRAARRWSRPRAFDGLQLVMSALQPGPAVVGAATMVHRRVLEEL